MTPVAEPKLVHFIRVNALRHPRAELKASLAADGVAASEFESAWREAFPDGEPLPEGPPHRWAAFLIVPVQIFLMIKVLMIAVLSAVLTAPSLEHAFRNNAAIGGGMVLISLFFCAGSAAGLYYSSKWTFRLVWGTGSVRQALIGLGWLLGMLALLYAAAWTVSRFVPPSKLRKLGFEVEAGSAACPPRPTACPESSGPPARRA